jgi:hypothetical protein
MYCIRVGCGRLNMITWTATLASTRQNTRGTLCDVLLATDRWEASKVDGGSTWFFEPRTCMEDFPQSTKTCAIGCGQLRNKMPVRRALSTFLG